MEMASYCSWLRLFCVSKHQALSDFFRFLLGIVLSFIALKASKVDFLSLAEVVSVALDVWYRPKQLPIQFYEHDLEFKPLFQVHFVQIIDGLFGVTEKGQWKTDDYIGAHDGG